MSTAKVKRGERVKWLKELFSPKKAVPPPAEAPPTVVWKQAPTQPERPPDFGTSSQFWDTGDGLTRRSEQWGNLPDGGTWEDRLVATCPHFVKCAAFLKQKYHVSHEDIQFIGQTLYQGFTGAQPEIHSADGTEQQLMQMERELVNDIRQVQMACLGGKGWMRSKSFIYPPSRAAVIAAYVACPANLGERMQAEIDAAIWRAAGNAGLKGEMRADDRKE